MGQTFFAMARYFLFTRRNIDMPGADLYRRPYLRRISRLALRIMLQNEPLVNEQFSSRTTERRNCVFISAPALPLILSCRSMHLAILLKVISARLVASLAIGFQQ